MINPVLFSIIIPCLNEEKYLPLLLKDLTEQTVHDFEVIIVDGESEDKTVAKAEKIAAALTSYTILSSSVRNVAHQRNMGGKKARGKWLIFMDADNRIPSYFLQGLKYQLEKYPRTDFFTTWMSTSHMSLDEKAIARAYNVGIDFYRRIKRPTAVGALLGTKKSLFKQLLFNEVNTAFDDTDFVVRACQRGATFKIFREPAFQFSFRRFERQGTLKMLRTYAMINVESLLGRDISHLEAQYEMGGGLQYEASAHNTFSFMHDLRSVVKDVPQRQLAQIRRFITAITEFDI